MGHPRIWISHARGTVATTSEPRLASLCCFDGCHVDFPHRHHRFEGAFGHVATGRKSFGQNTWGDLPRDAPFVLAPAALAFLAAVADDCVPVAVRFFLIVGRDLE